MGTKINKKGFSTVEVLLVVLVILILGLGGWLEYKNNHKTKKTTTSSTSSMSNMNMGGSASSTTVVQNTVNTFKIPELGIQLQLPDSLKSITYSVQNYQSIAIKDSVGCSIASMTRLIGSYNSFHNDQNVMEPGSLVLDNKTSFVTYNHPQSACSGNSQTENQYEKDTTDFVNALKTVTNLN